MKQGRREMKNWGECWYFRNRCLGTVSLYSLHLRPSLKENRWWACRSPWEEHSKLREKLGQTLWVCSDFSLHKDRCPSSSWAHSQAHSQVPCYCVTGEGWMWYKTRPLETNTLFTEQWDIMAKGRLLKDREMEVDCVVEPLPRVCGRGLLRKKDGNMQHGSINFYPCMHSSDTTL